MAEIERRALFGKLTPHAFRALRSASAFSKMRHHPRVELLHWLHQLAQETDTDCARILLHFGVDAGHFSRDLALALDQMPRETGAAFDLAPRLDLAMERGWIHASLQFDSARVRSGHILLGCLAHEGLRRHLYRLSSQFERINIQHLSAQFDALLAGSAEADGRAGPLADDPLPTRADAPVPDAPASEALQRYTLDLTAAARAGKLDPVAGRDDEIAYVIDILLRRRQNNPILTGEAGVGKTAIVEGLARRIVEGEVPPALRTVSLLALDLGLLTAGAGMKGEFEQRLRQVIDAVQQAETPIILFIDEAHTLIGAGGQSGTGDAANLLKPALARGSLRTIAATTWSEYKKHIEKDPALTRRFQPVPVAEPDLRKALIMLRAVVPDLERHHGVAVREDALEAAVRLGLRYLNDRQLPDKAVSLLDTACAQVALSQQCMPAALARLRQAVRDIDAELTALGREPALSAAQQIRVDTLKDERIERAEAAAELEVRWHNERQLLDRLADSPAPDSETAPPAALEQALARAREHGALIADHVDAAAIARVVQDWTGIPAAALAGEALEAVLGLADTLKAHIVGQDAALEQIAQALMCSRAGLDQPDRPQGVFLLAGPSGVGKTETARALAGALFGGERHLITVNMGEFQEAHTVSTLKGAPPGYVGYGQGGVLTEAVRRRPYSVVLLDEIEKAHPDVHELFYQVFDQGWMEDGEGRRIDFRNTLILLTSNAGAEALSADDTDPSEALRQGLAAHFPAALIGRMTLVPYGALSPEALDSIVRKQFDALAQRLAATQSIAFTYDEHAVATVLAYCNTAHSGAREILSVLRRHVMPAIARAILQGRQDGSIPASVQVSGADGVFRVVSGCAQEKD